MKRASHRSMLLGGCAALLVASVALTACSSSSSSSSTTDVSTILSSQGATATAAGKIDFGGGQTNAMPVRMNQPTSAGTWGLTVTKLEYATDAGGAKSASGKELAVLTLVIENQGKADAALGPAAFALKSADNTIFDVAQTSSPQFIFNTPQPIKAGEKRTVKIAFSIDPIAHSFVLTFSPTGANGSVVGVATVNVY